MSIGGGGGSQSSASVSGPVGWKKLMHPFQKKAFRVTGPQMIERGQEALAGIGLTPAQREAQFGSLMDSISSNIGGQLSSLKARAAGQNLTGGALEESRQGIYSGGLNTLATGLRGIEELNMQQAQQKLADFLGWLTWHPPQGQQTISSSTGKNWNAQAALPGSGG